MHATTLEWAGSEGLVSVSLEIMEGKKRSLDHPSSTHSDRNRDWRWISEYDRSDRRRECREAERRSDGSCRKNPRQEETRTYAPSRFGNMDRRNVEPSPKRVKYNHSSPSDRVKSDETDSRHQKTSTYPDASNSRRRKDRSDSERCSQFGLDYSKHPQTLSEMYRGHSRERDRHKQSHTNDDKTSSLGSSFTREWERGRERNDYHNKSPGLTRRKLQLPVDGATSPKIRCEVVPYVSSEASSTRERHSAMKKDESVMRVLSMVDSSFVPSLPEKYYSFESDRRVTSTAELVCLHINFEQTLLSVGGAIPPRWRLLHQQDDFSQPAMEKVENKPESLGQGAITVAEGENEKAGSSITPEVVSLETDVSRQSSISCSGEVAQSFSSSPLHKPKLHDDLCYNVPSEVPLVCKRKHCCYGKGTAAADLNVNPGGYYSYAISVEPTVNFELMGLTQIKREDGKIFVFQGFSILSHTKLDHLPQCKFERYGGIYSIKLHKHPTLTNFTLKDALLCQEFFFVKLLELYDWIEYIGPFSTEVLFIPRFVRETKNNKCEVLSLAEVVHFVITNSTLITKLDPSELLTRPNGFLLFSPDKSPSCCRVDEVSVLPEKDVKLGHWCFQLQSKIKSQSVVQYKSERQRYAELNSKRAERKLTRNEHFELRDLKEILARGNYSKHQAQQAGMVRIPIQDGLMVTNLYYDFVQYSSLLPLISHHVLIYDSLLSLEDKLGYKFKDSRLLLLAITHPSTSMYTYSVAEDHIKNALANGGVRWYKRLETAPPPKKMKALLAELEKGGDLPPNEGQRLQNNEQLEYLGDALLEYQCSLYLYLKHPDLSVGQLVKKRQNLVKNHFLQELAAKLDIEDYGLYNVKHQLTQASLRHFSGNCIETILGAMFLDGGAEETRKLFGSLAFSEISEYEDWMNPGVDPVKSAYPDGDRHLIKDCDLFQSMVKLEEKCGTKFQHIGLLARAFTHSSHQDTKMTMGNYQRLEFLGDAILQFLVSKYIYHRFPAYNEGHFSMIRTSLVHNKHLASLCQKLGFHEFIITSESKKEKIEITVKIMADVVESYLGALTLDQGLEAAENFLQVHLFPTLSEVVRASQLVDSNTLLHQAVVYTCKQQGIKVELPVYKKLGVEGTPSSPIYTIAVQYGKKEIARGSGRTLKEARSTAADNALKSGVFRIPPTQKSTADNQNPDTSSSYVDID